jgi:hypothetical protein
MTFQAGRAILQVLTSLAFCQYTGGEVLFSDRMRLKDGHIALGKTSCPARAENETARPECIRTGGGQV